MNIPLDELRDRLAELPKDKMIYTFCAVGLRGYLAYRILTQHGFDKVRNLSGGLKTYRAATTPIIIREENGNEIDESPIQKETASQTSQPNVSTAPVTAAADASVPLDQTVRGCLRVTVSRSDSENEENNGYTGFRRTGGNHLNRSRFSARRRRMVQFDG